MKWKHIRNTRISLVIKVHGIPVKELFLYSHRNRFTIPMDSFTIEAPYQFVQGVAF